MGDFEPLGQDENMDPLGLENRPQGVFPKIREMLLQGVCFGTRIDIYWSMITYLLAFLT